MGFQLTYDPLELQFQYKTQTKQYLGENKKAGFFWRKPGTTTTTTTDDEYNTNIKENTQKILASSSLDCLSKNQSDFEALLLSVNTIRISGVECLGGINVIGNNMTATAIQNNNVTSSNTLKTTMKASMTSSFTDSICDKKTAGGSSLEGITGQLVDGAASVVNNGVNSLAAVLGASNETNASKKTVNYVKNKLKTVIEQYVDSKIDVTNIQRAKNTAQSDNSIVIDKIRCNGPVNIRDNNQLSVVEQFLTILFENDTEMLAENTLMSEIETIIETEYADTGDVAAIGEALAENIMAVGSAAKDIGTGIATAITPVTTMVENVSEDAAGAAETAMLAMIAPVIVFIIVLGVVVYSSQSKGGKKTNNNNA
tara:strand:+ start:3975 stop:5081 length:1107 start_codon:yes stop_codon:yes gene_type:complete